MNPQVPLVPGATVQEAIENLGTIFSRKIVTVGDGYNTFGDFNGTDAIQQAIAANPNGVASDEFSLIVFVKWGEYAITTTDPIDVGVSSHLVLIGESSASSDEQYATVIRDDRSDLLVGAIHIEGGGFICQNIVFTRGTGIGVAINNVGAFGSPVINLSQVLIDRCSFVETNIRIGGTRGEMDIKDSVFSFDSTVSYDGNAAVFISPLSATDVDGITIDHCNFLDMPVGSLPIAIGAADIPGRVWMKYLRVRDCRLRSKATTTSPEVGGTTTGVITVYKRNPAGNPSAGNFTIDEISFDDCEVFSDKATDGYSMLMYVNLHSDLEIDTFKIKGGRWITNKSGQTYTAPFYLGSDAPEDTQNLKHVIIDDVQFGWGDTLEFGSSGELYSETGTQPPYPDELTWPFNDSTYGAMTISAWNIEIHNLHIRATIRGDTGEVCECTLVPAYQMSVDGLFVNDFLVDGTASPAAEGRIFIFEPVRSSSELKPSVLCRNMIVDMGDFTSTATNTFGMITIGNRSGLPADKGIVTLENCQTLNSGTVGALFGQYGFQVQLAANGTYVFRNCISKNNLAGFEYTTGGTAINMPRIIIDGGEYSWNVDNGSEDNQYPCGTEWIAISRAGD
jgi:hypothetical protein